MGLEKEKKMSIILQIFLIWVFIQAQYLKSQLAKEFTLQNVNRIPEKFGSQLLLRPEFRSNCT